jgi:mRNA interferase MazF
MYKRGDIVLVDNPQTEAHGHVMCGIHPAVIIQNNTGNEYSDNVIVAYLSSKLKKMNQPTHVILQWYEGLNKTSMLQAEQIATISKTDIISKLDRLRDEDISRVDRAVANSLALGEVV